MPALANLLSLVVIEPFNTIVESTLLFGSGKKAPFQSFTGSLF
jgi:hypothetical protein